MKLFRTNNVFSALLVLSQSNQIHSRIITEVTEHGMTLLKGSSEELDQVKASINEIMDDAKNRRSKRGLGDSFGIKELIIRQIASQLDRRFAVNFNWEAGESPARGAYNYAEMESQLVSTGLKKDADDYGVLPLPRSHYCRYRVPTEVGKDTDNCCEGENKQCYTEAGCFCDESCYTKYGDCCTDHFVKCYQKLKLCLISIDDEKAEKEKNESAEQYNSQKNHISQKQANEYARSFGEQFEDVMQAKRMGGFFSQPDHLTPNECCAQKPYNSQDQDKDGNFPFCCAGELTWAGSSYVCPN